MIFKKKHDWNAFEGRITLPKYCIDIKRITSNHKCIFISRKVKLLPGYNLFSILSFLAKLLPITSSSFQVPIHGDSVEIKKSNVNFCKGS